MEKGWLNQMNKYIGNWKGIPYKSIFNRMYFKIFDIVCRNGTLYVNVVWDNGVESGEWEWADFKNTHIGMREVKE